MPFSIGLREACNQGMRSSYENYNGRLNSMGDDMLRLALLNWLYAIAGDLNGERSLNDLHRNNQTLVAVS